MRALQPLAAGSEELECAPADRRQAADAAAAPLSARILAAFADYLLVNALMSLCARFFPSQDQAIYSVIGLSALYYVLGNSRLGGGATPGKRAFGLRVCSLTGEHLRLLRLDESLLRYLACLGLVVLLAEVPERILRAGGVIASPFLLEAPMWLALVYTFGNAFAVLLSSRHQGFHDLFAKSIVIRGQFREGLACAAFTEPRQASLLPAFLRARMAPVLLGTLLGTLLWLAGMLHPAIVRKAAAYRFYLERAFPVRIVSMGSRADMLQVALLDTRTGAADEASAKALLEKLGLAMLEKGAISAAEVARIEFTLHKNPGSADPGPADRGPADRGPEAAGKGGPLTMVFETSSIKPDLPAN